MAMSKTSPRRRGLSNGSSSSSNHLRRQWASESALTTKNHPHSDLSSSLTRVSPSSCRVPSQRSVLKVKSQTESVQRVYPRSSQPQHPRRHASCPEHVMRNVLSGSQWDDFQPDNHEDQSNNDFSTEPQEPPQQEKTEPPIKRLNFCNVTVHYHDIVLGDHPCTNSGPPLQLGWQCLYRESWDAQAFEEHVRRWRPKDELTLPDYERTRILVEHLGGVAAVERALQASQQQQKQQAKSSLVSTLLKRFTLKRTA